MTASAGPALQRLHHDFGDRVAFLTLYVREAHPGERLPESVASIGGLPPQLTLPVACGPNRRVT